MDRLRTHGSTSNIENLTVYATTGAGFTGLAFNTSGLIVSTQCENEATPTVYSVAAGTIEAVGTLGTFAAPTATKCRLKLLDDTNARGRIQVQLANARYSVSSAKSLTITLSGVSGMVDRSVTIQLTQVDLDASGGKVPATLADGDVSGYLPADVIRFQGAEDGATGLAGLGVQYLDNSYISANPATGGIAATSFAAGAINAAAIATDAIGSLELSAAAASEIAAAILVSGAALATGTVASTTGTTTTLDTGATATADLYIGSRLVITGGTGAGQERVITAYSVGRVATHEAWVTNPTGASTYAIQAARASPILTDITAGVIAGMAGTAVTARATVQGEHLEIYRADAYANSEGTGRRITFTESAAETHWPTTLSSVKLTIKPTAAAIARGSATALQVLTDIAGTITQATGSEQACYFELTSAQTDDLASGTNIYTYWVRANTATSTSTLRSGSCTVRPDPTV